MSRKALPEEFWQVIDRLPNSWVATSFIWYYLFRNPRLDEYATSLEPELAAMLKPFPLNRRSTEFRRKHAYILMAKEIEIQSEFHLRRKQDSFSLKTDYQPLSQALIDAGKIALDSQALKQDELRWPVHTETSSTMSQVNLYYGDGSRLYNSTEDGPVWTMTRSVKLYNTLGPLEEKDIWI